jgi:hypothetical protein
MTSPLRSVRPYVVREAKAYCAACGRRRLCRIEGTRFVCCPDCDAGHRVDTPRGEVIIAAGEVLCANCGRNALVASPTSGTLECPMCDTPPWEREQVAQPAAVQLSLLTVGDTRPAPVPLVGRDGTAAPDSRVRTCGYCGQTCWHHAYWQLGQWRWRCAGCGNRLSASRARGVRGNKRGDRR